MVTDVERRREIFLRHGRCYICLKARHISRYCRSNLRCVKCQRRHHVSICDQQAGTTSAMTGTVSGDHQAILLQTATATIASPSHPETRRQIRLTLDGGSQRSYVTTHTQQALGSYSLSSHSVTSKVAPGNVTSLRLILLFRTVHNYSEFYQCSIHQYGIRRPIHCRCDEEVRSFAGNEVG